MKRPLLQRIGFLLIALATLLPCHLASAAESPSLTLPDFASLVGQTRGAVVHIRIFKKDAPADDPVTPRKPRGPMQETSIGSGFVVSPDGLILTNRHVVADADRIRVRFADRSETVASVLGVDPLTDVAVLKVSGRDLPIVRLGDSSQLQVGQWVLAIGAPLGFDRTATHGIISALGRSLPNDSFVSFIQSDVPINPGNSGGPLFDLDGRVVGINSQIVSNSGGYMGLSFAIPINVALNVAKQIVETGSVKHGWLGVSSQEMTLELAYAKGLKAPRGALVNDLVSGGPADRAGLRPGDVILGLNQIEIVESGDLPPLISAASPGTEVILTILRDRQLETIKVSVGERGKDNAPGKLRKTKVVFNEPLRVGVSTVESAARQVMDIPGGVLVEEVKEGPGSFAGIRPGDVLIRVGKTVPDAAERFGDLVSSLPTDEPVAVLVKRSEGNSFLTIILPKR